jgi:hypothetical protein
VIERTAAEARARNISVMGADLGAVYSELWQQIAWLHIKWSEYVVLFGTKPSRVHLMNEAAPRFTRLIQDMLWDDVLIHIARLTDPPETRTRQGARLNLTVQRLPLLIVDTPVRKAVEAKISEVMAASEFCRDWRNRRIAHNDLEHALDRTIRPLKEGSRLKVKEALALIEAVMNVVSAHYFDSQIHFGAGAVTGGAMRLLHVLDSGLQADRAKQERIKSGQYNADDLKPRDI